MPSFAYQTISPAGQQSKGVLQASDEGAAAEMLRDGGNVLLSLEATRERTVRRGGSRGPSRLPFVRPRMATIEVALKQLSVMLESGLTLLEALRAGAEQSTSRLMRLTLLDIAETVQGGSSFAEALKRHSYMGRMVRQLVEVGEQTGTLEIVLERASESMEKRRLLMAQAVSALLYPLIVFVAAIGVTVFMLVFAIPRLTTYLQALGRPLPPMTQVLVDASNFLLKWWPVMAGSSMVAAICFAVAYSTPPGRLLIDSILLRVPLIGYILRTSSTALFSRSMSLLLSSGVTIIEALRTCQELHSNRRLATLIAKARENVISGQSLAPGLSRPFTFTPMLPSMTGIGERSGNLDRTLESCAVFHEQRLTAVVRTLASLVEIAVIIIIGGIVGYIYIAFMLALYGAAL
ncbi:MAG: type II secretion system F family protein [Planctomycetota bacterium]